MHFCSLLAGISDDNSNTPRGIALPYAPDQISSSNPSDATILITLSDIEQDSIENNSVGDPYIAVLDQRCEVITYDDDSGGVWNSRLEWRPQAFGLYYLVTWDLDHPGLSGKIARLHIELVEGSQQSPLGNLQQEPSNALQ